MTLVSDAMVAGFSSLRSAAGVLWTPQRVDATAPLAAVTVVVVDQSDDPLDLRRGLQFFATDYTNARVGDKWIDPVGDVWTTKTISDVQDVITRIDLVRAREDHGA